MDSRLSRRLVAPSAALASPGCVFPHPKHFDTSDKGANIRVPIGDAQCCPPTVSFASTKLLLRDTGPKRRSPSKKGCALAMEASA
jgi:hypothetical protein